MFQKATLKKLFAVVTALIMMMSLGLIAACGAGITLDKTELSLYVGDSQKLTATVSGDEDADVEWSTDNSAVATVRRGTVVAVGVGTATITAKIESGASATCSVTVSERTVTISESAATIDLDVQETLQLTATASDGGEITWSSDNSEVATVDGTGLVTGLDIGTAVITAQRGTARATCDVTVTEPSRPADYYIITKLTNSEVVADPGHWHYHADGAQGSEYNFEGKLIHKNSTATATLTTIPNPENEQYFYFRYQPDQVDVGKYYTMTLAITLSENASLRLGSRGADEKFAALEQAVTANTETTVEYVGYRNTVEPFSVRINSKIDAEKVTISVKLVSVEAHDGEDLPEYHYHEPEPEVNYEEIGQDSSEYDITAGQNKDVYAADPGKWYYNSYSSVEGTPHYNNGTITFNFSSLSSNSSSNDQLRYKPDVEPGTKIKVEFTVQSSVAAKIVIALNNVNTFASEGWTEKTVTAGETISMSLEIAIKENQIVFIQVRATGTDQANAEFTFTDVKIYKESASTIPEDPTGENYTLNPNGNNDGNTAGVTGNPGVWAYMVDGYSADNTTITKAEMKDGTLTWTLSKTQASGDYYLRIMPDFEIGTQYKITFNLTINRTGATNSEYISVSDKNGDGTLKYVTTKDVAVQAEFTDTLESENFFQLKLRIKDASEEDPITITLSNITITAVS